MRKNLHFSTFSTLTKSFEPLMVYQHKKTQPLVGSFYVLLHCHQGREPERQHLSRRFAQREARNVRRHMSQELRSVATNDAIRISSARGQP